MSDGPGSRIGRPDNDFGVQLPRVAEVQEAAILDIGEHVRVLDETQRKVGRVQFKDFLNGNATFSNIFGDFNKKLNEGDDELRIYSAFLSLLEGDYDQTLVDMEGQLAVKFFDAWVKPWVEGGKIFSPSRLQDGLTFVNYIGRVYGKNDDVARCRNTLLREAIKVKDDWCQLGVNDLEIALEVVEDLDIDPRGTVNLEISYEAAVVRKFEKLFAAPRDGKKAVDELRRELVFLIAQANTKGIKLPKKVASIRCERVAVELDRFARSAEKESGQLAFSTNVQRFYHYLEISSYVFELGQMLGLQCEIEGKTVSVGEVPQYFDNYVAELCAIDLACASGEIN